MARYRGFRGQVPYLSGLGQDHGYLLRADLEPDFPSDRFPGAIRFCGRQEYTDYVSQYGIPPAGSHIIDSPYAAGPGSACYDRLTAMQQVYEPEYVETAPPEVPLQIAPPDVVAPEDIVATVPEGISPLELEEWKERLKQIQAAQMEFEARQYAPGGAPPATELEYRAGVERALRTVTDAEGVPIPAPTPEKPAPNFLPLIIGAALIYLMGT